MWQPSYATADDLAVWLGVNEDPELDLAISAASRSIDQAAGRQFGLTSTESRWYTAVFYRDRWLIDIDDTMDTDLVIEVDQDGDGTPEAEITAYKLTPINAAPIGRPWTRIEVLPSSAVKPNGLHHAVKVTAKWGWSAVPSAIRYATLLQAARLIDRRDNITGALTSKQVDDVTYGWTSQAAQELDADVLASIAPYRRLWAAA